MAITDNTKEDVLIVSEETPSHRHHLPLRRLTIQRQVVTSHDLYCTRIVKSKSLELDFGEIYIFIKVSVT